MINDEIRRVKSAIKDDNDETLSVFPAINQAITARIVSTGSIKA